MSTAIAAAAVSTAGEVWSGASPAASPTQKMSNLFGQIDTAGSGTITQDQFNQAFQTLNPPASFQAAGAASVWSQVDPKSTGSVSQQSFVSGMTTVASQLKGHHHHHHGGGGASLLVQAAALDGLGNTAASPSSASPASGRVLNTVV